MGNSLYQQYLYTYIYCVPPLLFIYQTKNIIIYVATFINY